MYLYNGKHLLILRILPLNGDLIQPSHASIRRAVFYEGPKKKKIQFLKSHESSHDDYKSHTFLVGIANRSESSRDRH